MRILLSVFPAITCARLVVLFIMMDKCSCLKLNGSLLTLRQCLVSLLVAAASLIAVPILLAFLVSVCLMTVPLTRPPMLAEKQSPRNVQCSMCVLLWLPMLRRCLSMTWLLASALAPLAYRMLTVLRLRTVLSCPMTMRRWERLMVFPFR